MINENITIYNILPLYFVYTRCILNHERNEISTYILNIFQYLYSVIFRTNTRWSFCGTSARRTTWGLAARGTPPPPATSGGGDTEEDRGAAKIAMATVTGGYLEILSTVFISAANRLIGEVVQSRRRPLLGPSPGESGYYRFHI